MELSMQIEEQDVARPNRYVVSYRLPYTHWVEVGISAESEEQAIERAQSLFDLATIWDDTEEVPLLADEFIENDGTLCFSIEKTLEEGEDWPEKTPELLIEQRNLRERVEDRKRIDELQRDNTRLRTALLMLRDGMPVSDQAIDELTGKPMHPGNKGRYLVSPVISYLEGSREVCQLVGFDEYLKLKPGDLVPGSSRHHVHDSFWTVYEHKDDGRVEAIYDIEGCEPGRWGIEQLKAMGFLVVADEKVQKRFWINWPDGHTSQSPHYSEEESWKTLQWALQISTSVADHRQRWEKH